VVEWLKVQVLSSNMSTAQKKKKRNESFLGERSSKSAWSSPLEVETGKVRVCSSNYGSVQVQTHADGKP
jgi:hypothetical protein